MGQSVLESTVAEVAATTTPLVLGHCTGSRAGEVVQLTRPKCYLGAGSLSTNDTPMHNLAGVHCLILRGPQRTIVRRWSQTARLNGRPFNDAALSTGDRLQLGAIELEVLADASDETLSKWRLALSERDGSRRETRESALKTREDELTRRASGLERNEHELQQKAEQALRLAAELEQRQVLLDSLAAEVCARENDAGRRSAANDQLRLELDTQADLLQQRAEELEQAGQKLKQQRVETELEQSQLVDILRTRTTAWEAQQAAEIAILAAREKAIAQAETRLAERNEQFAVTPPSETARAELDQQRQDIERERLLLEQTRATLETARQEIDAQRESSLHNQQRQQELEAALAHRAKQHERADAERDRQCDELASQRLRLETESQLLSEQRAALELAQQSATKAQADSLATKDEMHQGAIAEANAELERRRCELTDLQQQLAERERHFDERLAAYSAERVEFAASQEQATELLRQLQEQRREALEQLLAESQQGHEQIAKQEQQLAERATELDVLGARQTELLESRRAELEISQTNFAAERTVRQRELEETRTQLEIARRQYQDATQDIQRQHSEIASRQATCDEQLAELNTKSAELSERERTLAEQQQLLVAREQSLADRETTAEPMPATTTTASEAVAVDSAAPENTKDVFRRLGVLSLLRETPDETAADEFEAAAAFEPPGEPAIADPAETELANDETANSAPVDCEPEESAPATAAVDLDDADEAQVIERYMPQLLSRMHGGKAEALPARFPVKPSKSSSPVVAELPPETTDTPIAPASEIAVSQEPPAVPMPRRQHPSSSDLSAMRELANQSTQAALDTHTRAILLNDLYVKTIICLTGIVSGIVLLSWVPQLGWFGLLTGAACFLGSILWGVKIGMLCREFLKASGVTDADDGQSTAGAMASADAIPEPIEPTDTPN